MARQRLTSELGGPATAGPPCNRGGVPRLLPATVCAVAVLLAGCTSGEDEPAQQAQPAPGPTVPSPGHATETTPTPEAVTEEPDAGAAMATVRELAALGPREATSAQYRRAAQIVDDRLTALGYLVTRHDFRVPAGVSWGVPVAAGTTTNLVARLPGPAAAGPHVVVGAHLDTVPQAPGAEDNASGVAVMLELARLAAAGGTRRPVTFVAFAAEEPRGPGDDEHHFGSQDYVARVARGSEVAPSAMVALDRVGAPGPVPVCTGGLSSPGVRRQLLAAAQRLEVPARACENRTSDHWPFAKAGHPAARLGGNDYPAYHSARDLPRVVSRRQLDRVARVMWEWLRVG